ncbi:hypothetical protein YC2023_105863 [Brassica napus]
MSEKIPSTTEHRRRSTGTDSLSKRFLRDKRERVPYGKAGKKLHVYGLNPSLVALLVPLRVHRSSAFFIPLMSVQFRLPLRQALVSFDSVAPSP